MLVRKRHPPIGHRTRTEAPCPRAPPRRADTGLPHSDPALVPSPQGKHTSARVRAGYELAAGAGEIATEGQAAGKRNGRRGVVKTAGRAPGGYRATKVKQKPRTPNKGHPTSSRPPDQSDPAGFATTRISGLFR